MCRTCIPAEAEPLIHSSGCYPLVNFSRPFCQNHGIILPSYVYLTPSMQIERNDRWNGNYDYYLDLNLAKIAPYFKTDISSFKKCMKNAIILVCHMLFPRCDRTGSVLMERMVCRESCIEITHSCGQIWTIIERMIQIRYPDDKWGYNKQVFCEFPYRNAGDSPECYFFNRHANIKGNINILVFKQVGFLKNYLTQPLHFQKCRSKEIFLLVTSNVDSRCYTKFDWLWKTVEPVKFSLT